MVTGIIDATASSVQPFSSTAAGLTAAEREALAVQVLARTKPVSELARRHQVSRPFLYRQARAASEALQARFDPSSSDPAVLFYLPVTRDWLHQFVLALTLEGHAPFRGIQAIVQALFDYDGLSLGSLHTILQEAVVLARGINQAEDLSAVRVGVHDEIFQARRPVLVGADARSTYCYLLADEDHRDETTWGTHLLDLERRGFHPDYTIADGGVGLRAGQNAACPDVPCHGDVFHAERDFGQLATYLENRALGAIAARQKAQSRLGWALHPYSRKRHQRPMMARRLEAALIQEQKAISLADDIRTLADWMRKDILALAGPDMDTRRRLFGFVVEELLRREPLCPHRIAPVRRMLQGQRDGLLAFAAVLQERYEDLAARFDVPVFLVQAIAENEGRDPNSPARWSRQDRLRRQLGHRFHQVQAAVRQTLAETPRASSLVENLNSRLRCYFFLRRQIGEEYLELLRFFLNHRRFPRSQRPERVGRSPAELLTGRPHEHWLELLGHRRFHRN